MNGTKRQLSVTLIGSHDFGRRSRSAAVAAQPGVKVSHTLPSDAWAHVLSERPHLLMIEIGVHYSERDHAWTRSFLTQLRERFKQEIFVAAALIAPEKVAAGGDLLFAREDSLTPSGLIDTFLVSPPGGIPSLPQLNEQIASVIKLYSHELDRREAGAVPIPTLCADGWVQSLADPASRELWMLWLPRYASYTNENPIIIGATGTGKTRLAHALHLLSGRTGPFISITPRDFSSSELIQAELFGAVAGAYTGAVDKWGMVKSAEGGTLFIDELQSIDKELQGKLITFIENKTYRRVGSAETTKADVRFVFASNRPIAEMVQTDTLRDDFAFRLERVQLELLPLSMRRLDIAAALAFSLAKIKRQRPQSTPISGFSSAAFRMLFSQNWPGNLRQLENTVAQLCEIADIRGESIIDELAVTRAFNARLAGKPSTSAEVISQAALKVAERSLTTKFSSVAQGVTELLDAARLSALEASAGDTARAAQLLGENQHLIELFAASKSAHNNLAAMTSRNEE